MTIQEKTIEQLERISSLLAAIGEKEDYTDVAIQALEQTRWIPCSERLPKENGNYLAFYRTSDESDSLEFMTVDHFNEGGGWLHEENGRKAYKKVIAWLPLPEPYKE